jgi:hypothetical protein
MLSDNQVFIGNEWLMSGRRGWELNVCPTLTSYIRTDSTSGNTGDTGKNGTSQIPFAPSVPRG